MPESCAVIPTDALPTIGVGQPVPDYTYPLRVIDMRLQEIKALLEAQRAQDEDMYPQPGDENNYVGITQTCTSGTITTITWAFLPNYIYFFKKIYADAQANLTYEWTFQATTETTGGMVVEGNEHDFNGKIIKAKGNTTLSLAITNAGGTDAEVDIVIQSWARRKP